VNLDPILEQLADMVAARVAARLNGREKAPETDRLLDVHEAAVMLCVKPRWLYRRSAKLPFAKRLSPGVLRFSEAGIRAFMANGGRAA
jgi:predicted DNA-binding transcriptional regulator AlpA